MLAIQKGENSAAKCTPNVLACRINRNGPVNASERYWNPEPQGNGSTTYFRGRKLKGRGVNIPDGYRGVVLRAMNRTIPAQTNHRAPQDISVENADEAIEEDDPVEVEIAEETASFDEIMVWGHEAVPDTGEDPYAKGIQEWISFAEAMHSASASETSAVGRKN